MCIPPTSVKMAQAKAFAASGLVKDARLDVMRLPGTSMNPIGFLELPIFLALAWVYRAQFETKMLGPMFLIYLWKECIPMSVCLHRYFSHKGFKCGRVTQFALYIGGCLASQVRKKRPSSPRFTPAAGVSRATTDAGVAEASRRAGENAAGVSHSTSAWGRPNRSRAARYPRLERVFHVLDMASSSDRLLPRSARSPERFFVHVEPSRTRLIFPTDGVSSTARRWCLTILLLPLCSFPSASSWTIVAGRASLVGEQAQAPPRALRHEGGSALAGGVQQAVRVDGVGVLA